MVEIKIVRREPKRVPKQMPSHIVVQYDEKHKGWGMYNTRLQQWCGDVDEIWGPKHLFKTEELAKAWYMEQM
jgi:hypothetical protein